MRIPILAVAVAAAFAQQPELAWEGVVDGISVIHVQGNRLQIEDRQGLPVQRQRFRIYRPLPSRREEVRLEIVEGRGRVSILQQPQPANNYTLSIAIEDRQGGAGFYSLRAYWEGGGSIGFPSPNPGRSYRGDSVVWSGRVDGEAVIECRGDACRAETVRGQPVTRDRYQFSAPLPRRDVQVSLEHVEGRGEVRLIEQPREENNHTARVLIRDNRGGGGDYSFALVWQRPARGDSAPIYSRPGMRWSGRVDGRVRVIVESQRAWSEVISGAPVAGERAEFERALPNREFPNAGVRRLRGRGDVEIVEYPSRRNGYRLVFEIDDRRGGGDDYVVEVGW
jgi:hypothetical protein